MPVVRAASTYYRVTSVNAHVALRILLAVVTKIHKIVSLANF